MSTYPIRNTDIAIIGMAGRYPQAPSLEAFWRKLCAGEEFTTFYTEEDLRAFGLSDELIANPKYVKAGGFLETLEEFDAGFFGYNPREASFMDPQQRHFLECAWESLEDAGYDPSRITFPVGVFGGAAMSTYVLLNIATNPHLMTAANQLQVQVGNDNSYLTTRVSYKLNLKGPSHTVQSACSTSLVATHVACQSLLNWECDMALAGGTAVHATHRDGGYWHLEGGMSSPDGHCRTFDAQGGGPVFNTGVAVVVLKRLEDAIADHDHIYAVIRGSAINNDGALKAGYAAPTVAGQAQVIAQALVNADVDAEEIDYVEAHGTATPLGDPIEVEALTKAYRTSTSKTQFCAIGSVKSNVGHLDAAAGVTSLIKAALSLHHKLIPPSLNFNAPNPMIDFAHSPFSVVTSLTPWAARPHAPRRAGVSSFGIGGTNAHAILQEAPPVESAVRRPARPVQLLTLSARTASALEAATRRLGAYLGERPDLDLADVAYTLQVGRKAFSYRRTLACRSTEEAVALLSGPEPSRLGSTTYEGEERAIIFMFSGQGSQYPQMIRELYAAEPQFRAIVDECCTLLKPHLGLDLRSILSPGDAQANGNGHAAASDAELSQTWLTQPALFVSEYALAKLWMAWGLQPQAMIGHSIGEYVAATLAGVFSLEDALKLVATRGKLMQSLPHGAMLTVPLSEAAIAPYLGSELSIAAINEAERTVVSGTEAAIDALAEQLRAAGHESRRLHTSHAFHSPMMDAILDEFTACVQATARHAPELRFISNVTGTWITAEQATDPSYWTMHLRQAVRFADGIAVLMQEQHPVFLEVGPGQTLATLVRRHHARSEKALVYASLRHPQDQQSNLEYIVGTLGQLWQSGVEIDWPAVHADEERHRVSLPTYPFERQRYWIEPGDPTVRTGGTMPTAPAALSRKADLADWLYIPSWKRSQPPVPHTDEPRTWLVFVDNTWLSSACTQRLAASGDRIVTVGVGPEFAQIDTQQYVINPQQSGDYDHLLGRLAETGSLPHGIVYLWTAALAEGASPLERAEHDLAYGFYGLLALAQSLGRLKEQQPMRLHVVSSGMQAVANEPELHPTKAPLLGLCKVIAQEYKHISCQSIDVALPAPASTQAQQLVEQLWLELHSAAVDPVIAYRGMYRWAQTYEAAPLPEPSQPIADRLRTGGVYLITGGLGGIGLEVARELARSIQPKLVLTSRTPLPDREAWSIWLATTDDAAAATREKIRQVQALEAAGAEVLLFPADITDPIHVEALVRETIGTFGTLHGVFHAAGLPGAGIIQLKRPEDAVAVLAPKIQGTLLLDSALRQVPLDFMVLFSSITAITGGMGQADYCAANSFLDAFAHANSQQGVFTVAINWDAWQKVGMAVATEGLRALPGQPQGKAAEHPLLDTYTSESPERAQFTTEFDPRTHWVLGEHRVLGTPTIPGATYPEVVYSAFTRHRGSSAVEIRDLLFMTPFMVGESERKSLRVLLEGGADELAVRISSQATVLGRTRWKDHVVGKVAALPVAAQPVLDLPGILIRCAPVDLHVTTESRAKMAEFVDVGPRWNCIKAVYAGTGEGLAVLELDESFVAADERFAIHPALMDIATSFAIQSIGEGNYLPLSYARVQIYGAFPKTLYCYVRLPHDTTPGDETVVIDVAIMDAEGNVAVNIEGFTVKRVAPDALVRLYESAQSDALDSTPAETDSLAPGGLAEGLRTLKDAILPEEGIAVLRRILALNHLPQIIVSTRDLAGVIDEVNRFDPHRLLTEMAGQSATLRVETYPRPDLPTPYVAPGTELEQRIATLWQDVLCIEQVGIHDNFFELGGDSLLGTQIMVRAKEAGFELSPNQFFQHQTIAELAQLLGDAPAPDGSSGDGAVEEEALLANIDQLSEADLDALLARLTNE
ncbi:MAG TPA: SDR family NAD(P)-dependent oxidoreductase [Herpetosiphonaceae bacterium]